MARSFRLAFMAVVVLALSACTRPERPSQATEADPLVAQFFEHARSDPDRRWLEEEAGPWLEALPAPTRERIADQAMRDPDPVVRGMAPVQYYALGLDERGDRAFVELTLDGVNLMGLGWGWLHSADRGVFERRMSAIRRIALLQYADLPPERRERARKLLCEEGKPCDPDAEARALKQ